MRAAGTAPVLLVVALFACACTSSASVDPPSRDPRTTVAPPTPRSTGAAAQAVHPSVSPSGRLVTRAIPGTADHFAARAAKVYLPPITVREPSRRLPVLVLLHGTPGGPDDWPSKGELAATANAFAAAHGGLAPVIVMPDINGTRTGDTECIRTPTGGNVLHYLLVTLPRWVIAHLPADPNRKHWAIAGLSEGGTCAAMLALTAPSGYHAFVDLSGLAELTLGPHDDPTLARQELFGGSQSAYDAHDAPWLLRHHRYPGLGAWFESGDQEHTILAQQRSLATEARAAGLAVHITSTPGRHEWSVWIVALRQALPWVWREIA